MQQETLRTWSCTGVFRTSYLGLVILQSMGYAGAQTPCMKKHKSPKTLPERPYFVQVWQGQTPIPKTTMAVKDQLPRKMDSASKDEVGSEQSWYVVV